jgi:hypothetical protein
VPAVIGALFLVPRAIERTDTTCSAISSHVVDLAMGMITEVEIDRLIRLVPGEPPEGVAREFVLAGLRHTFAEKVEPKLGLAGRSWYGLPRSLQDHHPNPAEPEPKRV